MRAIYAFSGDPITYGHIDIVKRAAKTYDQVVVAIGENPQKQGKYLFDISERLFLAESCLREFQNVECVTFTGLLGEYAYRNAFDVIIRGVRNNTDLDGELIQFGVNETLHPTVDTVFFPTRRHLSHISSGVVKAIVAEGGDVSNYCPLFVKEELEKKILKRFTIGIAGGIASGKTYVAKRLVDAIGDTITASYISLDAIGHQVLEDSDPIYLNTRNRIARLFGEKILRSDGSVNRRALGKIVFNNPAALMKLDEIMHEPMMTCLYNETREIATGVIIIEGAILVEAKWTNLVNNNVVLVDAPEEIRLKRLVERSQIKRTEALTKIRRQISSSERRAQIEKRIKKTRMGKVVEYREYR